MANDSPDLDQVSTEDLQRHYWRAYSRDTPREVARAAYTARYGQPPARITRGLGGIILAGPIPTGPRDDGAHYSEAAL